MNPSSGLATAALMLVGASVDASDAVMRSEDSIYLLWYIVCMYHSTYMQWEEYNPAINCMYIHALRNHGSVPR